MRRMGPKQLVALGAAAGLLAAIAGDLAALAVVGLAGLSVLGTGPGNG